MSKHIYMKKKEILVFGASGFIGTNIIRKLTKNNHKVTAVTRNVHQKGIRIKTQGNFGYLNVIEANIFDTVKLQSIINTAEICINLVGILHESGKNTFNNILIKGKRHYGKKKKSNNKKRIKTKV